MVIFPGKPPILGLQAVIPRLQEGALERVESAFRSSRRTQDAFAARRKAIAGLRGIDSAEAVRALVAAFVTLDTEADPIARQRAYALVNRTSIELPRFRKKLDPIRELQDLIIARLRVISDRAAVAEMFTQLVSGKTLPFSLKLVLAAGQRGMTSPGLLKRALDKHLQPGDTIAMLRVVRSLGPRGRFFAKWVTQRLSADSATIRLEAMRSVVAVGIQDAMPQLVDRLAHETGRLKQAAIVVLEELSGKTFGDSILAWHRWLKKEAEAAKKSKPRKEGDTSPTKKHESVSTYFGIPQEGDSILYVYDRSDSMKRGMRKGGSRISRSRKELSKALGLLPQTTRFNIVAFSVKLNPWRKELQPATEKNVEAARKWLYSMDPNAGTSSFDALERAFQFAGHGTSDRFYELDVETIFFLSDGEPTVRTGGLRAPIAYDKPQRILSAIRRWNAANRIVIHTIGLGLTKSSAIVFMQGLAAQNGGQFAAFR